MDDIFSLGKKLKPKINIKTIRNQLLTFRIDSFTIIINKKHQLTKNLYLINGDTLVSNFIREIGNEGDEILIEYCCSDVYY